MPGCVVVRLSQNINLDPRLRGLPVGNATEFSRIPLLAGCTEIKAGDKARSKVTRGIPLEVRDVNSEWLWVSWVAAGWIKKENVTTPDKAIEAFTAQIRQNPQDSGAYYARGNTWHEKGEFDIAIKDFSDAITLNPKGATAYYMARSNCWRRKKNVDKTLDDLTEAIRLDPKNASAYNARADAWVKKTEFDKAIMDASEAVRLSPEFEYAYAIRAAAWAGKRDFEKALSDCNEAIRINPKSGEGYQLMAELLAICPNAAHRNGQKAVEYATKACERTNWKVADCLDTLAAAYAETGDFTKAVEWQTKAISGAVQKDTAEFQERLDIYKSGKPYRDEPRK